MADSTSKRRRGSVSREGPPNVGPQTHDTREPSQRASQSQKGPDWYSAPTSSQAFDDPRRSSVPSDTSMVGQQNSEGKMLLMPLPRRIAATSRASERNRTTHACDLCRKAKAKCTGGQPCQKCKNEGKECIYGDGKRDKERKVLERTAKQNESLRAHTEALKDTIREMLERTSLSESEHNRISELLTMSPSAGSDDDDDYFAQQSHLQTLQGEKAASGDVGSTGSLDVIDVDTNRNEESRAVGFMGKSSSSRWIQRAEKEVCDDENEEKKIRAEFPAIYHTGDPDLCGHVDRGSHDSWKYEMPEAEAAIKLVESYFAHVHPDFPILFKNDFMQKFHYYSENRASIYSEADNMALCQINCVFAISCTYAHLTTPEYEGDHRDHLVYYDRTRALGLEQQPDNAHTSLDYICALGLLGLYLITNSYINRAWNTVGLAVRNAVTLGLHIRSEAAEPNDFEKELRIRIWWSIFSLEHLLNEITGRPSCISYRDISAPHPVNCSEEELFTLLSRPSPDDSLQSTKRRRNSDGKGKGKVTELPKSKEMLALASLTASAPPVFATFTTSTYFIHRTALSVITNEILNRLFCAAVVNNRWNEVQDIIREIDTRLQKWKSNLPDELQFSLNEGEEDEHRYQKKGLAVMYYTARMILHRPALCRMEGRIRNESTTSQKFNRDAVAKCVESARALLATIGRPGDPTKLYRIQPWWEILHHLCQAAGILMLEIAFCACHTNTKDEALEVVQDAKDVVHWLRAMSRRSIPARRAWQYHDRALRMVATKIGADMSDMATETEVPPGWYPKTRSPHTQETLANLSRSHQGLSGDQTRNLAATAAWVHQGLFQSAAASQPEMNPMYASGQYPNPPTYFPGRFEPSVVDPYASFDSPGFPRYDHHAFFMDPSQEMQEMQWTTNMGTYQPYSGGTEMEMPSQLQQDTAQPSQLQKNPETQSAECGYQNAEDQYPSKGSYRPQWQQGGSGSG